MKTKFIIDVEKKGDQLEVKYTRRDLKVPDSTDDKLILLYIESLIRSTIDGGFAPGKKEVKDGETVEKQQDVSSDQTDVA